MPNNLDLQNRINQLEEQLEQANNNLACEIHDSLAQTLASLTLRAEVLDKSICQHSCSSKIQKNAHKIRDGIILANKEMRNLIKNFRAPVIQSFHNSIISLVDKFREESDIFLFLQYNCNSLPFGTETKTNIYRIVNEALSNTKKHSNAKFVRVMFSCENSSLRIIIEDDGKGFDLKTNNYDAEEHIGLTVMQQRANKINALLEVESEKNNGCLVKLTIQLTPPQLDLNLS